jgi:hypothetical protein
MAKAVTSRSGTMLNINVVSHSASSAREIADRLSGGLERQGIDAKKVMVAAMELNGFEEVRTGVENIPVTL